ncbi:hypothetical protein LIER_33994 [Lithospermum erythrorhizon]|uniref:Uncharacterized protein n=1 Tax=Lithospermum erythrorhizon TaxID=34254 RepID=A0AAV3S301_LITER
MVLVHDPDSFYQQKFGADDVVDAVVVGMVGLGWGRSGIRRLLSGSRTSMLLLSSLAMRSTSSLLRLCPMRLPFRKIDQDRTRATRGSRSLQSTNNSTS